MALDIDYQATGRAYKVGRLYDLLRSEHRTLNEVAHWTAPQWNAAAARAGVNAPSPVTRLATLDVLAGSSMAPRASTVLHAAAPRRAARR